MALIHHERGEIHFKVVYCGPPLGGKTTSIHYIHRRLDPRWRGDLVSIATEQNRTISFDFLPVEVTKINGYHVRFQLYTVPGQEVMRETRKAVLAGTDAVVFVADSSPGRLEQNRNALDDTYECLRENRIDPHAVPFVFQFNKRDLADATSPALLDEALGVKTPSFLSCARTGYQIFATLDWTTQQVLAGFRRSIVTKNSNRRAAIEAVV